MINWKHKDDALNCFGKQVMKKTTILILFVGFLCLLAGLIYLKKTHKPTHLENAVSIFYELMPQVKIETITPLTGGASGSGIYKVTADNRSYILRILDPNRAQQSIQRELSINQLMSELGIAPTIYASSIEQKAFIMQEVTGTSLWGLHLTPHEIKDLADKLRLIHQPYPQLMQKQVTPREIAERIVKKHTELPLAFQEALIKHEPHFKILETKKYVLTHTDLNPGNILRDNTTGTLKIIDWEDATWTHPYLDIATLFIFYNLNPQERGMFLKEYGIDSSNKKELDAAYKIQNFIYALSLLRISYRLSPQGETPNLSQLEVVKQLFEQKDFAKIIAMFNKDVTYALALLLLEQSFEELD